MAKKIVAKVVTRFDLDIRALERSVLPFVLLNELAKSQEELSAMRLKDRVVEAYERAFPSDSGELYSILLSTTPFEFHASVLYPLIEYMVAKERRYIERKVTGPLAITEDGRRLLEEWRNCLERFNLLLK